MTNLFDKWDKDIKNVYIFKSTEFNSEQITPTYPLPSSPYDKRLLKSNLDSHIVSWSWWDT